MSPTAMILRGTGLGGVATAGDSIGGGTGAAGGVGCVAQALINNSKEKATEIFNGKGMCNKTPKG